MTDIDARLREDVHLLGELLGNTIREQYGDTFLDKIEQVHIDATVAKQLNPGFSFAESVASE